MFKAKFIISTLIFIILLIFTSLIKNETRIVEKKISKLNSKIFLKKKDINETQLDFYYLTSPSEIEKKLDVIGYNNYQPIEYSNIFLNFSDFTKIKNKITNLKRPDGKKIQKK